ncbi:uncharacterized protein LOC123549501 isoform X6 [Mercenaria mercenaria]|uniref:uncharacterized protein LOC123549501 isoform X6 n=1 Tax=Mercenaria mercenaria TaxID=6596 RepID=UPI00234F7B25|nr:uncharacterized protein LOC123549501 isoform X6 [Mercenaria mercenaria]
MANPFLEKGYTMPYQISQNKYREQVFGHLPKYNYPQQRPEPLAGRNVPPRNYRPSSDTPVYQDKTPRNYYDSPRQQQQQEQYEQRYNPNGGQDVMKPHPGWVLLLRFHRDGEVSVRRALTMAAKHIDSDGGRILGLARSYSVRLREGGDAWVTFGGMRHFGGGNWDVQQTPSQDDTHYAVLAIYYPSLSRAIQWFDRDSCFKQKDFPPPYTTDCIALPLSSSVDTKFCKTLVMSEYPRISHPEYFRDKFSIPTQEMMRTRFRATPYVVKASSIPVDDPRQRVARHLRGSWIKRNSIITLSMFDSLNETHRYFTDPEYLKCKEAQDRVSAPTTVIMDLEDWRM